VTIAATGAGLLLAGIAVHIVRGRRGTAAADQP